IVDFNKPSTKKRLWIVDLDNNKLLFNTLVAHGQGSGDDLAQNFSNLENSHQSSLGFYVTSDIYSGKHGLSMKLDGMDAGFNTNAKDRSVVVHGAAYVSQDFIKTHGRLGRSYGCPALPVEMTKTIIDHIKGKTTLYINGPAKTYKSKFADLNQAVNSFITTANTVTAS
ncbi:MAG: murein L,D-transpeptidase catalytic domain family protein, partial [Daejeonella sp.]